MYASRCQTASESVHGSSERGRRLKERSPQKATEAVFTHTAWMILQSDGPVSGTQLRRRMAQFLLSGWQ